MMSERTGINACFLSIRCKAHQYRPTMRQVHATLRKKTGAARNPTLCAGDPRPEPALHGAKANMQIF
jgi:hypothetical protein